MLASMNMHKGCRNSESSNLDLTLMAPQISVGEQSPCAVEAGKIIDEVSRLEKTDDASPPKTLAQTMSGKEDASTTLLLSPQIDDGTQLPCAAEASKKTDDASPSETSTTTTSGKENAPTIIGTVDAKGTALLEEENNAEGAISSGDDRTKPPTHQLKRGHDHTVEVA